MPPEPPRFGRIHQGFEGTVDTKFPPLRSQRVCVLYRYFHIYCPPLKGLEARGKFTGLNMGQPFYTHATALSRFTKEVLVEIFARTQSFACRASSVLERRLLLEIASLHGSPSSGPSSRPSVTTFLPSGVAGKVVFALSSSGSSPRLSSCKSSVTSSPSAFSSSSRSSSVTSLHFQSLHRLQ